MKVLLINGSNKASGTTNRALEEVAKELNASGIETEIFQLGAKPINDCIGCMQCRTMNNRCVFNNDPVNELIEKRYLVKKPHDQIKEYYLFYENGDDEI